MKKAVIVGPFGGESENSWDHGVHTTVRQMFLHCGMVVDYIAVEYDENGSSKWSDGKVYIGGNPNKDFQIKLDYPNECLTSISGYYNVFMGRIYICSMSARTRMQHHCVTLDEAIRLASVFVLKRLSRDYAATDDIVVNFISKMDDPLIKLDYPDEFLTSVTGYYDSINEMNDYSFTSLTFQSNSRASRRPLLVRSYNRDEDQWDDGFYTTIRQLVISSGSIVNSICIEYDENGQSIWSSKHGRSVGDKTYTIKLDIPDEFLISISGSYSSANSSSTIIESLTFQSNKKIYGPFGTGSGNKEFSLSSISYGKIIGFHGTCSDYLHSIGVYLKPIPMSYQLETCKPCGGQDGNVWDDGFHTTIRQLIVGVGSIVHSLQVEYDKHGRSMWCGRRGYSIGGNKYMIEPTTSKQASPIQSGKEQCKLNMMYSLLTRHGAWFQGQLTRM
ncbi:jacalin-related lectin 3 [Jatropha curcas]|uniref:jacalin-related lectin 3 n=1 Tax=Jatropha curcas TaxID=180498 RepID=UPI0018960F3E|nr:jacalin-related lectin 3 [Jatropha curcas]